MATPDTLHFLSDFQVIDSSLQKLQARFAVKITPDRVALDSISLDAPFYLNWRTIDNWGNLEDITFEGATPQLPPLRRIVFDALNTLQSPHLHSAVLQALREEVHQRFARAGGYTEGKHLKVIDVHKMFDVDSATNTFGMRLQTVYPQFTATSRLALPPLYYVDFSPNDSDNGIPRFSLLYYNAPHSRVALPSQKESTTSLRIHIYFEKDGRRVVNALPSELLPDAAQLLISSLGAWACACEPHVVHLYITDPYAPAGSLPLTPIIAPLYNDYVAGHIATYQSLAQDSVSHQPALIRVEGARIPFNNRDTFNPFASVSQLACHAQTPISDSFSAGALYHSGILDYSGNVPEDPTPGVVLKLVDYLRRWR